MYPHNGRRPLNFGGHPARKPTLITDSNGSGVDLHASHDADYASSRTVTGSLTIVRSRTESHQ